jgi:hypothetical protein
MDLEFKTIIEIFEKLRRENWGSNWQLTIGCLPVLVSHNKTKIGSNF